MRYQYRHELDIEAHYPALSKEGKHILAAAFTVAEEAHRDVSRNKIDPQWMYITHPIMTCDILYRMGERDPALLASALLHDALEAGSKFEAQPENMRIKLMLELAQQFGPMLRRQGHRPGLPQQIGGWTHEIMDLCYQVTKPEFLPEGKEVEQIERAEVMTLPGKKLKIADQAASLMCNLTMANDPEAFPVKKERGFVEKALSLVIALVQSAKDEPEAEALAPWEWLFGRTMLRVQDLFEFPPEADAAAIAAHREPVREVFDWDRLIDSTTQVSIVPPAEGELFPIDLELKHMDGSHRHLGLARVYVNDRGEVARCIMWNDRNGQPTDAISAMQEQFTESLRRVRRMDSHRTGSEEKLTRSLLQPGEQIHAVGDHGQYVGSGRSYRLSPPMKAEMFVGAARASMLDGVSACSWEDMTVITSEAERVRAQAVRRPQGPLSASEVEAAAPMVEVVREPRRVPSWVGQTVERKRFDVQGRKSS